MIGVVVVTNGGGGGGASCSLGASGVGLIADGLTKNKNAGVIVAEVTGSYALSKGCEKAINHFVNEPDKQVDLQIETPNGDTTEQQASGSELAQPPPEPPSDVPRAIGCIGWQTNLLYQLCVDGTLEPPSRP